jgi:hypothetical protein
MFDLGKYTCISYELHTELLVSYNFPFEITGKIRAKMKCEWKLLMQIRHRIFRTKYEGRVEEGGGGVLH